MALSVSGFQYSPTTLEQNNSDFLGSNSPTPSPTSYKSHPSDLLIPTTRQRPPHPSIESNETLLTATYQHSPPPSALIPPSRPHKLAGELVAGRPRGQSASSRPTLRLHIANPTDSPPNDHSYVQEQAVRSTLHALNAKAQTMQSLYPSSVGYATINNIPRSLSPTRRRGETFSDFTSLPAGTNAISGLIPPIGPRSASPLPIRITTANLNYVPASAVNSTPNSSSSNLTSASSVSRSSTKRPYRASPLVGPQAMSTQGSATGTNSSVSTLPISIFDDYHSSVSTPATQESASSEFSSHSTSSRVPTGPRNRPLPVPPPITTSISTLSTTPSKVVSPLIGAAPHPHPLLPTQVLHGRSSSGELNLNDPITAELAYRMEKRRGKQPMRGNTAPSSPTLGAPEEDMPYELRSEKWKGKQRMRDNSLDAFTLAPQQQLASPTTDSVMNSVSLPQRSDTNSSRSSDDREVGLPPSLSGTLSNRPSRASVASSHSSTRSTGVGAVSEGGVSKWKGKGKEVPKTNSISSMSSLDRDSGGSIAKYTKGRGIKKSGSSSSFTNTNTNPNKGDSPLSTFSNSPVISPSIASSFIAPAPRHPPALMPGYQPSNISRIAAGSPRISSPRLPGDLNSVARSASPRTTAWSPAPPMPMYVDPPMPLNVRRVVSPATSPVIAPKLPPKDYRYQPLQPPAGAAALVECSPPMHTHPFEADDSDEDSDEEGKRLFKEVEAAYVSPSTSTLLASSDDRLVDVGYGYAEPGYEDDERVYIDDGFDHGGLDEFDDEFGFGVSASGQLVGGVSHPPSASASTLGHGGNVIHTGISSSRVSLAREARRSPSPMRYARRRRNSLFEDEDDSTGPESNGMRSPPIRPGELPQPRRSQVTETSNGPAALEGFVFVEKTTLPSPSLLVDPSTAVHPVPRPNTKFLTPSSPLSPSSSSSSSPSPSDPSKSNPRGRQRKRNRADFDPAEILGEELEMAFSKNPSPTRYPTKDVYALGAPAALMEDMVYVRGKWRMRSPSPGMSPISPAGTNGLRGKAALAAGGGLRKYASEESLLSAGIGTLELDYRGGRTEIDHSGGVGPGFAPLRSSGFEEFNLTPSPHLAHKRFADRAATPDSLDIGGLKLDVSLNQSRKSLSSKSVSSGRQTPNLRGPATKLVYADDYGFSSGWKAATELGREKSYKRPRIPQERAQERETPAPERERGRGTLSRAPTKLEKKRPVHRGLSLPRSSAGGGSSGSDLEIRRSGTTAASNHRHTQQQPPPEHISYELWIERGMDRKSAAVKGKKSLA